MKKIVILVLLVASLGIGIFAILTAIKLTTKQSVAPTVPQVTPHAEEPTTALSNTCSVTFTLNSPTPGPSSTPSPTVSPTPKENVPPTCTSLSASPTSGDSPLLVTYVASGYDDNSGYVAGFEFTFGDGQTKKIEQTFNTNDSYTVTHTYSQPGTYIASVRVKDNNGTWSSIPDVCKQTITVNSTVTGTPGPTTVTQSSPSPVPSVTSVSQSIPSPTEVAAVPKIPTSGNALPTILTITGGSLILALGLLAL